jgi:hypothetical protein
MLAHSVRLAVVVLAAGPLVAGPPTEKADPLPGLQARADELKTEIAREKERLITAREDGVGRVPDLIRKRNDLLAAAEKIRTNAPLTAADVAVMRDNPDIFARPLRDRSFEIADIERRQKDTEAKARRGAAARKAAAPLRGFREEVRAAYAERDFIKTERILQAVVNTCGTNREGNTQRGDALFTLSVLYARRGRTEEAYQYSDLAIRYWVEAGLSTAAQAQRRNNLRELLPARP